MKNSTQSTSVGQNRSRTTNKHSANLQKNSTLYFQIGLIIALLLSIFGLEYQSPQLAFKEKTFEIVESDFKEWNEIFKLEQNKPQPVKKAEQFSEVFPQEAVPNDTKMVETEDLLLLDNDSFKDEIPVDAISYVEKDEPIEEVSIEAVDFVPIYPGCENLESNKERKGCLQENLKALITKNFDTDRVRNYASNGLNRISVQFTVDENGLITDIRARAANEQLEKEAKRVIEKIPQMKPGIKMGKKVKVFYGQPILFKLDK